jgi:glucosamine--fructose-6-phosphate aminotransferase (isomerizing)
MGLRSEILEQPEVAARLLADAVEPLRVLAAEMWRRRIGHAVIAARGSSDHAAVYGQYALGVQAGLSVALATPSVISRYGAAPHMASALVIGVSQSGRSPDVVGVVAEARRQGALTAAITNDPQSPLAMAAEHLLPLDAGVERSIAATKTYTAELLMIAMLAATLADDGGHARRDLALVSAAMRRALDSEAAAEALAHRHRSMTDCVVLGRGYNLATALEWALKLKELAYVRAHAYSTADFQHGPVASLEPGGQLLAVSARGPMADDLDELVELLHGERKAAVLTLSDVQIHDAERLPFGDDLPEWLSPLVAILPAQLFCYHLALAKGLSAEAPRGLHKVTLTR